MLRRVGCRAAAFLRISAARRHRGSLKLNLFDDTVFEARVERVRPRRSGYFQSGRIAGQEADEMTLVVNGPMVVGKVWTPQATCKIRSVGSRRHVIRQIDPSALPQEAPPVESPPPRDSGATLQAPAGTDAISRPGM